ncbi:MAG: undecaprenyl/decaprenyl-phosphate alpha-N-acetylglucosaminyl 1-phosphate transferase [Armatimonadetes bacterium]|nr:undecaprenyl/decaprenyl-phosphate alpha-N-acetylglucosaminyl 1-phosphate transferase [Armatimonadota bacterium]
MPWLLGGIVALTLAAVLTPVVRAVAKRIGALDRPEDRRVHHKPTATAGGLAIFVAFWIAVAVVGGLANHTAAGILLGSVFLAGLCLLDDIYRLPPAPRFVGHIVVAMIAWQWGVRVAGVTNPLVLFGGSDYLALGLWSAPLTVVWIVFMINAINWIDGLDGLAAGVSALAAGTLAAMAISVGMSQVGILGAALAGACLGFLPYNFSPASIFMGDTGAMFLGYLLACLSVTGAFKSTAILAVFVPILVLGIPIYDTLSTTLGRIKNGKPIYNADRSHLHHRLLARGFSQTQTVLLIYGLTAILCGTALWMWLR